VELGVETIFQFDARTIDTESTSLIYCPLDTRLGDVFVGMYDINGLHCAVFGSMTTGWQAV
jgi:hypothetical protein